MTELFGTAATVAAVVGAGVAGGVYFTFSVIVSPALRRRSAPEAVAVMQRVNDNAVRAPFMIVFFGGALAACAAAVSALLPDADVGGVSARVASVRVIGAGLTLASFATTILFNVPRNQALARFRPSDRDAAGAWRSFDAGWSRANTTRAVLAIVGSAFLAASLLWRG
ncbi:DUF1772 domain-containing protein [Cryobacterium frigoriphilum]|uniref:DUF1772 domain-containing protein n=1 Tax=Cryobacterium frigoriphilum TaxID=1259150 RepID=A0A4R8ZUV4_9MICO|nr:anthrone oxygenase family protein [Cryobacterium frigoriphilum]TFD46547.1 DUF1772 domain-containing protein [Cryobacterium frigoriphilum]